MLGFLGTAACGIFTLFISRKTFLDDDDEEQ